MNRNLKEEEDDNREKIHVQYLLLVRHGSRDKAYDVHRGTTHLENLNVQPNQTQGYSVADISLPGWPCSQALAGWVAEFLHLWNIKVAQVITSPAVDAQETAQAYLTSFNPQGLTLNRLQCSIDPGLRTKFAIHPDETQPDTYSARQPFDKFVISPNDQEQEGLGKALMISGHQPQLTWIANAWLRKLEPIPLNLSEALLIRLTPSPEAIWAVGMDNFEEQERLREKIKSKLDLTKWFSGFISVFLGLVSGFIMTGGYVVKHMGMYTVGIVLILGSLVFTLMTLFAYDTLRMPELFWKEGPRRRTNRFLQSIRKFIPGLSLERPPTPVHWILYSNMIRVWHLFTAGVYLYFIGITLVATSIFTEPFYPLIALGGLILVAIMFRIVASLRLGSHD